MAMDGAGNLYIVDRWHHRIRKIDSSGIITTIAGTGEAGFGGDGGPAGTALLNYPFDVAVDGAGILYISDRTNHRIRKVDTSGVITTVAGTGEFGFGGDGGPAVSAQLRHPLGLTLDGSGNLYFADLGNDRIRKVDTSGVITTVAGDGTKGYGGDGGQAVSAQLRYPNDVALDGSGNFYIADNSNHRIRKVDTSGVITTVAGTGVRGFGGDGGQAVAARLANPSGVAVDSGGNLYIADDGNDRIRKVDTTGVITTVAGDGAGGFSGDGGQAVLAQLRSPTGVAVDSAGNLYIADEGNDRIRKVDTSGVITTVAGTDDPGHRGDGGAAVSAWLVYPNDVATDGAGNLYICSGDYDGLIRKVDSLGVISTIAGPGTEIFNRGRVPAIVARLKSPYGVATDAAGNFYIADRYDHVIRKVDTSGVITTIAGTTGTTDGGFSGDGGPAAEAQLAYPYGVATDSAGNLYIADAGNDRIRKVDTSGKITTFAGDGTESYGGDGGQAISAQLHSPYGVAADSVGNVYIADTYNHRIRKVDSSGVITTIAGTGEQSFGGDDGPAVSAQLDFPYGVATDGAGNVYLADTENHRVRKVDTTGVITTVAGTGEFGFGGDGGPAVSAQLDYPNDVSTDGVGNLYIADRLNHRIRKVDSSGIITTAAGDGTEGFGGDGGQAIAARFDRPSGVASDGAGNIYIADDANNRIRKVDTMGIITTVAGPGRLSNGGDGAPAVYALLRRPSGVEADGAGNVYIADTGNYRIRKVDSSGVITTVAGTGVSGFGGDGGPAISAQLGASSGVATDGVGNLYIADWGNYRIRKVDTTGVITTVAGTGVSGFGGDGGPAVSALLGLPYDVAVDAAGNLYIADRGNHRIRKVDTTGVITTVAGTGVSGFGGDDGPAVSAQLNDPYGVTVDAAGNVYIGDTGNNRIRKVDTVGVITTIAGTGESDFGGDGGPAIEAQLQEPRGLATDSAGNVYISDTRNHRVRILRPSENVIPPPPPPSGGGGGGPTAPSAPRNLTAVGGDGLAVLRWDAPENDGGTEITDYEYRTDRSNPWISTGSTNTSHTVTGLVNGTTYVFQVRAVNSIGNSSASNQAEATPAVTGDRIYYFPHLAVGASWQTTITLINYSPEEVTCQTDFLSDQGSPLMVSFAGLGPVVSRIDVLPPRGAVHEETNVELSAPLAPGWARATCSGPVKASLLFRQHDSAGVPVAEAGVNATIVPATRFVTFAEQSPDQAGTGVAYANPSSTKALITFTAKDAGGETLASEDLTVSPGGHGAQNMASLFDLPSFSGSLEITSTEPIVSLSLNAEAAPIFSSLPPGEPDAAAQGPTTYYFPHLAVGASWQTTITYINDSSQEVTCETEFVSDHGGPLLVSFPGRGMVMNRTDLLPPGGSVHEETDMKLDAPLVPGWAKAACTGPVKASLLFRQYGSEGNPVAEAGVNAAAVPATRFVTFAEQAEGKTGTGVAYANPSATAAHVTFTAKDTEGQTLASVDRTLLPDGHDAQVMSVLFGFTSFSGSIEITSTEPIVSLSLNFEAAPVFSSLPPGEVD